MFKKSKLVVVLVGVLFSGYLYVVEFYDSSKLYFGGFQVSVSGKLYEVKWWVNLGQSLIDDYVNEWDLLWKLIGDIDLMLELELGLELG